MVVAFIGCKLSEIPFEESERNTAFQNFRNRQLHIIEHLIELGAIHFISGVDMGFDTWVAEDILKLRKKNNALTLECVTPFPGQADNWDLPDQKRRYKILTHANFSVRTSDHYSNDCYFTCNRYMVDKADVVVCAYNGKRGGTQYTVNYALSQNKIVIQIDPETAAVSILSSRSFN